jgi:predicted ATPase/DNA-binding winged helix-turn-helix (wHTH) protein
MRAEPSLHFDCYRLDLRNQCVWRGEQVLHLTAKAFTVLRYLVEHAGQLVTKEELFQAAWPDLAVSDAALTICIGEIRRALGETAQAPRCIATVHRRGYRFIAAVTVPTRSETMALPPPLPPSPPPLLVGRAAELSRLDGWLAQAQRGLRQVVFVTGEAGIGKTALVDAWLGQVASTAPLWVAWGQCLAHYGAGEAYLPVLDALGRVCRGPGGGRLLALLGQYAPTWMVQLPTLLRPADLEAVQRQVLGATRERMLRELAEALEAVTAVQPLVLVLEDLHWSDHATLDLIAWLARRREPARLLLLGTYRPVEVIVHGHPLRAVQQDLALHRQCADLRLDGLSVAAVAAYLTARFAGGALPAGLAGVLHQRTEGQPLFMVHTVEAWVQQGWLAEVAGQWVLRVGLEAVATAVPENVRQLIGQQFDGLSAAEQGILQAASVAGMEFSAAVVAAGVETAVEAVEERCEALVRRSQFLRGGGVAEWPDGTVAGRYGFVHALHQQVVYDRLPVGRRMQLHRRIGMREEVGYGARAHERAAELAVHFDQGRDAPRAVWYRQQAAENALRRSAYQEVLTHLTRGLEMLQTLPDTEERAERELVLQLTLGRAMTVTKGYAAPEAGKAYARARELCQQVGETPQLVPVLWGLWYFAMGRAELGRAQALAEHLLDMGQRRDDPTGLLVGHEVTGVTLVFLGDLVHARWHLEQALTFYAPQQHGTLAFVYGIDHGMASHAWLGTALVLLGYPDQGRQHSEEALRLAREVAHPHNLASALFYANILGQLRREVPRTLEQAKALVTLATEQGFTLRTAHGALFRGWALAMQGMVETGLAQMRQALAAWRATGATLCQSWGLGLCAEVCGHAGRVEEGLQVLAEALACVHTTGERCWEAELYRLKGKLLLALSQEHQAEAETCFHRALDVARRQQAKSLELRAALRLSRLWQRQGKRDEARALLAEVYGWFTEGFETLDLQEAQALLGTLSAPDTVRG